MNNLKIIILFIILLACLNVYALKVSDVPINDFVNDYANILTSETENYIKEKSQSLQNADGTQIVVVTIKSLENNDLEIFTNDLFNYYGIGYNNKGLLILLALEERKLRVEVGDSLEGILNDGKVGRMEDDYMIPYLKENNFDSGIRNGYNAFFDSIVKQNNLNIDVDSPVNGNQNLQIDIFKIVFAFFFVYYIIGRMRSGKSFGIIDIIILLSAFAPYGICKIKGIVLYPIFGVFGVVWTTFFMFGKYGSSSIYHSGGSSWHSGGGSFGGGFSGGGGHSSGGGASRGF